MKIYISGPITGHEDFRQRFAEAELYCRTHIKFRIMGGGIKETVGENVVLNPCVLPPGLEWDEYMKVDFAMVEVCDAVFVLPGWLESKGARLEVEAAVAAGKEILKRYDGRPEEEA